MTTKPKFCNKADPMGNGCNASWRVGGNYGYDVCCNPDHHDAPTSPTPPPGEVDAWKFIKRVAQHDERIEGAQATAVLRSDIEKARALIAAEAEAKKGGS